MKNHPHVPARFASPYGIANGAKLKQLVDNFRRRGLTASFGVDIDPKRLQPNR